MGMFVMVMAVAMVAMAVRAAMAPKGKPWARVWC